MTGGIQSVRIGTCLDAITFMIEPKGSLLGLNLEFCDKKQALERKNYGRPLSQTTRSDFVTYWEQRRKMSDGNIE